MIVYLLIVQYLIEKGDNIEANTQWDTLVYISINSKGESKNARLKNFKMNLMIAKAGCPVLAMKAFSDLCFY